MGDSGEGLIDAEARIQERMEEMQRERVQSAVSATKKSESERQIESLKLAKLELTSQLGKATHDRHRQQILTALADLDARIARH